MLGWLRLLLQRRLQCLIQTPVAQLLRLRVEQW
jgi:hypothetical protein